MSNEATFPQVSMAEKIKKALLEFFRSLGREIDDIDANTDLIEATGVASVEGLDFVLDFEDLLGIKIPDDFNPFVHPCGKRAMKFRELVEFAEKFVAADKGGDHGGK